MSLLVQGSIAVGLRKYGYFTPIKIPEHHLEKHPLLKYLFEHFSVNFEMATFLAYSACFLGAYVALELIYYRLGNRYWMVVESNHSNKHKGEEKLEMTGHYDHQSLIRLKKKRNLSII